MDHSESWTCQKILEADRSASGKMLLQFEALVGGLADGITDHGVKKVAADPLNASLEFAGGVALGIAFSSAPKCISVPAAMLSGMSMLKLGERTLSGFTESSKALRSAEVDPLAARRKIADATGAVAVESLLLLSGAGAAYGAGKCLSMRSYFNRTKGAGIAEEVSFAGREVPSISKDASPIIKEAPSVSKELVIPELRMTTEMSYKDASYFFPKLSKEAADAFLRADRSQVKFRSQYLRFTIDTLANDKFTIEGVCERHLQHNLGSDYVKMPVMERQHRRIMLSTRHKDDPLAKLYEDVRESVVKVEAVNEHGVADNWNGSGAFVDSKGTIATALHAVLDATRLSVRTCGGDIYPARLIAHDVNTDMALLKIDVLGREFKPLPISNGKVMDGDKIFVFGHPAGNDNMFVSPGFFHRVEPTQRFVKQGYENVFSGKIYPEQSYFAYTRPGNSGGPVVNAAGEIVSIHTAAKSLDNWNVSYGASSSELQSLLAKSTANSTVGLRLPFTLKEAVLDSP